MNLLSILTGIAAIGASVLALEGVNQITRGEFYLASISHLAQESSQSAVTTMESIVSPPTLSDTTLGQPTQTMEQLPMQPIILPVIPPQEGQPMPRPPEGEKQFFEEDRGEDQQSFVDPRQIQDGLRNMNQFRNEAKRTLRQIKKQASAADNEELGRIIAEVDQLYTTAANTSNLEVANDAVQEFHQNQYWDSVNKIRSRIEIPREIKQIIQSIKRLEKILQTKSIQNIGLDIARAKQTLAEMKQAADNVQNLYNNGEYQDAQEEMRLFHEGGHPGEIEGVIFRIRDIKNMAKRVKDTAVKAEIDSVLQEVIDTFNAGEYRDARETMDEYADDLQRLISQLVKAQSRRGFSRNDSVSRVRNLEDLVVKKLQGNSASTGTVNPFSK